MIFQKSRLSVHTSVGPYVCNIFNLSFPPLLDLRPKSTLSSFAAPEKPAQKVLSSIIYIRKDGFWPESYVRIIAIKM